MWRLLLLAALAAASESQPRQLQNATRQPPVEEVNRAMAAAKAALASAATEKAEAQQALAAAASEKRATEAEAAAEERKIAAEKASLRKKRQELSAMAERVSNAQKEKEEAVWAQEDADKKLQKERQERKENEGLLRNAVADNDEAAQMATQAKKQVDKERAEVVKVKAEEKKYQIQAEKAAQAEKVAQDAKAHADALSRQRSAELAVLQDEQRARSQERAKLLVELQGVENARRAVTAALAEAKNATRVAAQEVTDAGKKKQQARAEMKRAQDLMQVAQQMHDVAERAMVAARVLQDSQPAGGQQHAQASPSPAPTQASKREASPPPHTSNADSEDSEKAMEAAVAAAANADARLQNAHQELMKLQDQKAREEEWLKEKERELTRTESSLDHSRAAAQSEATELQGVWWEVRMLQLLLFVVLGAAGGVGYYLYQQPGGCPPLPAETKPVVTEEKAVGKSAQSPLSQSPASQSPVHRPEDFQEAGTQDEKAKADTPHFTPRSSPQTTPRDGRKNPPPPFGLGGAVNVPSLALPSHQGPRMYYMSPRCVKESPQMSRQTSPSLEGQSPDVATTKQELPPKLPSLPGSGKEQLMQPLLSDA